MLPPHCCSWVPSVWQALHPDLRLSLGFSISGKISLNQPHSGQLTKSTQYILTLMMSPCLSQSAPFIGSLCPCPHLHTLGGSGRHVLHLQVPGARVLSDGQNSRDWINKHLPAPVWGPSCFCTIQGRPWVLKSEAELLSLQEAATSRGSYLACCSVLVSWEQDKKCPNWTVMSLKGQVLLFCFIPCNATKGTRN